MANESSMVDAVWRRLCARPDFFACREVPALGRAIDIALEKEGTVYAFEFKMRDWRRALSQARDHRLAADYAYICMPRRALPEALVSGLRESGVGLAFYTRSRDWPFEIVIEAPRSSDVWPPARDAVRHYVRQNGCQS